jgi:hypothetical protein
MQPTTRPVDMTWLRRKWSGRRWRPGLALANLGLLLLGAIVVKALWDEEVLQDMVSGHWRGVIRWGAVDIVVLVAVLDVCDGLGALRDGVRRGMRGREARTQPDSKDAV